MRFNKFLWIFIGYFLCNQLNLDGVDSSLTNPFLWEFELMDNTVSTEDEILTQIALEDDQEDIFSDPVEESFLVAEESHRLERSGGVKKDDLIRFDEGAAGDAVENIEDNDIIINFNNIRIVELIKFISSITGRNFIFNDEDLQFTVTIVSEEPTTIDNVLTAVLQEIRVHGLTVLEQGKNFIIHKADGVRGLSEVEVAGEVPSESGAIIVTRVFRIKALDPEKAAELILPFVSDQGMVEVSELTKHVIVTDIRRNINKIAELLESLDYPNTGQIVGQYVVRNAVIETLVEIAQELMSPLSAGQGFKIVPYKATNSIFVVANPHLVERTMSLLQRLDNQSGKTELFDLETQRRGVIKTDEETEEKGTWRVDDDGTRVFIPLPSAGEGSAQSETTRPEGRWLLDPDGKWYFLPQGKKAPFEPGIPEGEPKGRWRLNRDGAWIFQLDPDEVIRPFRLDRVVQEFEDLPEGHIERTQFYLHKLQYRRGDQVVDALQQMALSLKETTANADLVGAIESVQWIEATNSLILTGTAKSIIKIQELIDQVDVPLRQVFIEMLVLETSVDDSLTYSVESGTRSGGGNTATSQAFLGGLSALPTAMDTSGVDSVPDANSLARTVGYSLGIIGQRITHNGTEYATIGALVQAVHSKTDSNIVLNPKLLAEDNTTAEIFVGINTPYRTDSISNDQGSVITGNFEYRDVGTTLRITPFIGSNNVVTLEIEQEVSRIIPTPLQLGPNEETPGPTTSINRTITKVHVPDESFLILSGMLQDEFNRTRNQVPCLGGIPIIGAGFSDQSKERNKLNTMIFVRPTIVDTEQEINELTRRQQNVYKSKTYQRAAWKDEVQDGLEFLNIQEDCCDGCDPYPP